MSNIPTRNVAPAGEPTADSPSGRTDELNDPTAAPPGTPAEATAPVRAAGLRVARRGRLRRDGHRLPRPRHRPRPRCGGEGPAGSLPGEFRRRPPVPRRGPHHRATPAPGHPAGPRPRHASRRPAVPGDEAHQGPHPRRPADRAVRPGQPTAGGSWRSSSRCARRSPTPTPTSVIHRDLKPANVMVGAFGEVQVMDWGLAKVLAATRPTHRARRANRRPTDERTEIRTPRDCGDSATQAGSVLGTPAFMPPEQAGGEIDKIDERADVFGLGAMLCVILTGQPPYSRTRRGGPADGGPRRDWTTPSPGWMPAGRTRSWWRCASGACSPKPGRAAAGRGRGGEGGGRVAAAPPRSGHARRSWTGCGPRARRSRRSCRRPSSASGGGCSWPCWVRCWCWWPAAGVRVVAG